jgi:two-component sensor histidine kinase
VISDNGVGKPFEGSPPKGGLGTVIVGALVKQLEARMEVRDAEPGLTVSITRASFNALVPKAA